MTGLSFDVVDRRNNNNNNNNRKKKKYLPCPNLVFSILCIIMSMNMNCCWGWSITNSNIFIPAKSSSSTTSVTNLDWKRLIPTPPPTTTTINTQDYGRIIGGEAADPTLYPFYTFIEIERLNDGKTSRFQCGGTLIAPDFLLTASHCFAGDVVDVKAYVNNTSAAAFTGYEYPVNVKSFITHPGFELSTYTNDIAIVRLNSLVTEVIPIQINTDPSIPSTSTNVQVIGLGSTNEDLQATGAMPENLQFVELQVIQTDICTEQYANAPTDIQLPVQDQTHICAAAPGKDACQGDSGGPLFIIKEDVDTNTNSNALQVGIVSFGLGCARPEYYGVYTRISHHLEFIRSNVCGSTAASPLPSFCDATPTTTVPLSKSPTTATAPLANTPTTTAPIANAPVISEPISDAPVTYEPIANGPVSGAPNTYEPVSNGSNSDVPITDAPQSTQQETDVPILPPTTSSSSSSLPPSSEAPVIDSKTPAPISSKVHSSRSIQIARTGQIIATSIRKEETDVRFAIQSNQDFTLGLPSDLKSMNDLSVSPEGYLFGLSVDTPALCSFLILSSTLQPMSCITGDWSMKPYTGISAAGGYVVISGGSGGITVATYDVSTGILSSVLACQNCNLRSDDPQDGIMYPNVKLTMQFNKDDGKSTVIAAMSAVWKDGTVGTTFWDIVSMQELNRIILELPTDATLAESLKTFLSNLSVAPTNYPLQSDFYYWPPTKTHYLYTAYGNVRIYDVEQKGNQNSIGSSYGSLSPPLKGFLATCLAIDEFNSVMVVGGSILEGQKSAIAVYDILPEPKNPQLRSVSSTPIDGRVLSVDANGGKVAYVTSLDPAIQLWDSSSTKMSSITLPPVSDPSSSTTTEENPRGGGAPSTTTENNSTSATDDTSSSNTTTLETNNSTDPTGLNATSNANETRSEGINSTSNSSPAPTTISTSDNSKPPSSSSSIHNLSREATFLLGALSFVLLVC